MTRCWISTRPAGRRAAADGSFCTGHPGFAGLYVPSLYEVSYKEDGTIEVVHSAGTGYSDSD